MLGAGPGCWVQKQPLRSYRQLIAWQRGMSLVDAVHQLVRALSHRDSHLATQLTRAAVSVPANIAEGYGRSGRGEYLHFLSIATGSLREVETLALVARRGDARTAVAADRVLSIADETGRVLHGLRKSLAPKNKKAQRWPG